MPKRYALTSVGLDLSKGNNFEVDLPLGAQLLNGYVRHEPSVSPLVLSRPDRPARTEPVPYLLMLFDPDETQKVHRFFSFVFAGKGFVTDHTVSYVATFVLGMEALALFELTNAPTSSEELAVPGPGPQLATEE